MRRSGRTTRLADNCIQELFTKGYTICRDHYTESELPSRLLFDIVVRRLNSEHNRTTLHIIRESKNKIIALNENLLKEAKRILETKPLPRPVNPPKPDNYYPVA